MPTGTTARDFAALAPGDPGPAHREIDLPAKRTHRIGFIRRRETVKNRKVISVAIALVAVIAVSGVAYAFWTSSGNGSGSAGAGASPVH